MPSPSRSGLTALLARLEVYAGAIAYSHDRDPQVGSFDHDAWTEYCRRHGVEDIGDERLIVRWVADLLKTHGQDLYGDRPLPEAPTAGIPATPLKVQVMALRRSRGEALFHPGDAPLDQERLALLPGKERHYDRSQVEGVVEERHDGRRRVS